MSSAMKSKLHDLLVRQGGFKKAGIAGAGTAALLTALEQYAAKRDDEIRVGATTGGAGFGALAGILAPKNKLIAAGLGAGAGALYGSAIEGVRRDIQPIDRNMQYKKWGK